jgi:exodeoxyribonuclease V beta subunit
MDIILSKIKSVLKNRNRAKEQNFFYALNKLVEIYAKAKKALYMEDSELSFSDVSVLVYFILHQIDESDFLYFRLDGEIEHILLDEFQDTSILQYEILHPLINEALSGKGVKEKGSFFFVGDTKQSIYRFRGGFSALFHEVAKLNSTTVKKLKTNYRSQKQIVDFVNDVFKNKIKNYTLQEVLKDKDKGYVEVIENEDLLQEIYRCIKNLKNVNANESDIAILCFTNLEGELIKEYLQNKGIFVVTETSAKLISQKSIKALLEYLKYIYFKEDIFKYNFYALISKEVEIDDVDLEMDVINIVKNALEKYRLFEDKFNIAKFLEILQKYENIEEVLYNYERIEAEAISNSIKGIRILTVHKSKGLEFEHLIVTDRFSNPLTDRSSIIYNYQSIELKSIYLRIKGRDKIDKNYQEALENSKKLFLEDNINALYVAFTRAKRDLFIIKKPQKSSFDILDIKPLKRGELLNAESNITKTTQKSHNKFQYKEIKVDKQEIALKEDEIYDNDDTISSQNFGTALHYLLQMLEKFDINKINDAKDAMLNRYGMLLEEEEKEDILRRVENLLKNQKFLSMVDAKHYKEIGIKYKRKIYYIDLLVEFEDRFVIMIIKPRKNLPINI